MRPDIVKMTSGTAYRLDGYESYILTAVGTGFTALLEGQVQENLEGVTSALEWVTLATLTNGLPQTRVVETPFIRITVTAGTATFHLQKIERIVRPDIVKMTSGKSYRLDGYEGYTLSAIGTGFTALLEGQVQENLEGVTSALEWVTLAALAEGKPVTRVVETPLIRVTVTSGVATFHLQKLARMPTAGTDPISIITAYPSIINTLEQPLGTRQFDAPLRIMVATSGIADKAVGSSTILNRGLNARTQVQAFTYLAHPSVYQDRDVTGQFVEVVAPLTVDIVATSFTAQTVAYTGTLDLTTLRRGMILDTSGGWTGFLESWVSGTLTVLGWYKAAAQSTPPSGGTVRVNNVTKVWGHNVNVFLEPTRSAVAGAAVEYGLINNKTDGLSMLGVDLVNLGQYNATTGILARPGDVTKGSFLTGVVIQGAVNQSFSSSPAVDGRNPIREYDAMCNSQIAFYSQGTKTFHIKAMDVTGVTTRFSVDNTGNTDVAGTLVVLGNMELGTSTSAVGTPAFLDFHHGKGAPQDFNARLINGADGRLSVTFGSGEGRFEVGRYLGLTLSLTPTSSADGAGLVGDISRDDNYVYVKTSTGWKRSALTSF